jgi:tetratricopeptide (TPR) repeat protein
MMDDALFLALRARIKGLNQDIAGAFADIQTALEKDPIHFLALQQRGDLYFLQEEYTQAASDYALVLKHYPFSVGALSGIGNFFLAKEAWNKACEFLTKSLRIDPLQSAPLQNVFSTIT